MHRNPIPCIFLISMSISGLAPKVGIPVGSWSFDLAMTSFVMSLRPFLCSGNGENKVCMMEL